MKVIQFNKHYIKSATKTEQEKIRYVAAQAVQNKTHLLNVSLQLKLAANGKKVCKLKDYCYDAYNGDAAALFCLGTVMFNAPDRLRTQKVQEDGLYLLMESAQKGFSAAQFEVGCVKLFPASSKNCKDYEAAVEMFKKAAANDYRPAKDVLKQLSNI